MRCEPKSTKYLIWKRKIYCNSPGCDGGSRSVRWIILPSKPISLTWKCVYLKCYRKRERGEGGFLLIGGFSFVCVIPYRCLISAFNFGCAPTVSWMPTYESLSLNFRLSSFSIQQHRRLTCDIRRNGTRSNCFNIVYQSVGLTIFFPLSSDYWKHFYWM